MIKNYDDLNKFGKEMAVRQKILLGECIAAKQGRFRMTSTGFPDFIIYRLVLHKMPEHFKLMNNYPKFEVRFIECKSNGKLSKIEKEKARWYLENNYCSKFLIASRTKIKGRIVIKYEEFKIKFRRLKKYGR